jgi:hypothetical protein
MFCGALHFFNFFPEPTVSHFFTAHRKSWGWVFSTTKNVIIIDGRGYLVECELSPLENAEGIRANEHTISHFLLAFHTL